MKNAGANDSIIKLQVTGYFIPSPKQLTQNELRNEIEVVAELPIGKTTFDKAMKALKENKCIILTDGRNFYVPATVGIKTKRKILAVITHPKLNI